MTENMAARGEGLAGLQLSAIQVQACAAGAVRIKADRSLSVDYEVMARLLNAELLALEAAAPPSTAPELTFAEFARINRQRCESKEGFNHALSSWSTSDWFTAVLGELGEAANIAKKLNRVRDGIPGNKVSKEELAAKLRQELGDVFVYLDLLAQSLDVSIGEAATEVFNAKSQELGCPIALATPSPQAPAEQSSAFSTTSAREQSSATASDILRVGRAIYLQTKNWTFGISYPQSVDATSWAAEAVRRGLGVEWATDWIHRGYPEVPQWIMDANQPVVPAATQEPAGSGASNLSMCGVPMEIMGCFICQGEVKNWCPTHGNGAAAPGSPRKVGEEGALEMASSTGTSRAGPLSPADARPSSAPVGEQKQEEGV